MKITNIGLLPQGNDFRDNQIEEIVLELLSILASVRQISRIHVEKRQQSYMLTCVTRILTESKQNSTPIVNTYEIGRVSGGILVTQVTFYRYDNNTVENRLQQHFTLKQDIKSSVLAYLTHYIRLLPVEWVDVISRVRGRVSEVHYADPTLETINMHTLYEPLLYELFREVYENKEVCGFTLTSNLGLIHLHAIVPTHYCSVLPDFSLVVPENKEWNSTRLGVHKVNTIMECVRSWSKTLKKDIPVRTLISNH